MKIYLLLFSISLTSLFACTNDKYPQKIITENILHNSVQYKIIEKTYYSNELDTTITPYEVSLIKDNNDSVKKGYIWVENTYRPFTLVYNLKEIYLVMPTKNKTRLYPNYDYPFISQTDWIYNFLDINKFQKAISDTLNLVTVSDTIFNQKKCIKIIINFPPNKKSNKKSYIYIFDKQNKFPVFSLLINKTKEYTYYDELLFSNIVYDKVNKKKLNEKLDTLINNNQIVPYNPENPDVILENMLQIGDKAPNITGLFHKTSKNFDLSNYIGKDIIILDFWYTHCHPCIKAMPELSKLNDEYKDSNLKIFGLNYIDNNPKSIDNLNVFLNNKKITYDIILTKSSVDNKYKVIGYPSMYVIDLEGKIHFVEVGFTKESFDELKEIVVKLLKK